MVRPKQRYLNNGRVQTIFTVNFEEPDTILKIILPLMDNSRLNSKIIKIAFGIISNIEGEIEGAIEPVSKLISSFPTSSQNPIDIKFMLETFGSYLCSLPIEQQLILYKMMGNELNQPLKNQSDKSPKMEDNDLSKVLESSSGDLYEQADPRLKIFIEEAVKTDFTEKFGSNVTKKRKKVFCYNIIENFLKARNLRFVSLAGLSMLTLAYIFRNGFKTLCLHIFRHPLNAYFISLPEDLFFIFEIFKPILFFGALKLFSLGLS